MDLKYADRKKNQNKKKKAAKFINKNATPKESKKNNKNYNQYVNNPNRNNININNNQNIKENKFQNIYNIQGNNNNVGGEQKKNINPKNKNENNNKYKYQNIEIFLKKNSKNNNFTFEDCIDNDENINNNIELKLNPDIENKYISFNQNNFTEQIDEEDENQYDNSNMSEFHNFCLIPNNELFKICNTCSDINDLNERVFQNNKDNRYMTYPFDETNIFMILKQPKKQVKNRLMEKIKQKIKQKRYINNNKNHDIYGVTHYKIKEKDMKNYNNYRFHLINDSKGKNKNNSMNSPRSPTGIGEADIFHNNRKYKDEKLIYPYQKKNLFNLFNDHNIEKINNNYQNIKNNEYVNMNNSNKRMNSKNKKNNNSNKNLNSDNNNYQNKVRNNNVNNNNMIYINSFDERIEKIKEALNKINVIETLTEQAGLQCYKGENSNDDSIYYEKAKILNKEFYDNLDSRFNEIEDILNNLEN